MIITISPEVETMLRSQAEREGQNAGAYANALLLDVLEEAERDFEDACAAIAEGLADIEGKRDVPFEEVRAQFEAEREARRRKRAEAQEIGAE